MTNSETAVSYTCFDVVIKNNIAHIVLNRPEKRNSMVSEFWDELPAIIRDIDNNARARVIVISSTGPHFSSGLDLSLFGGNEKQPANRGADTKAEDADRLNKLRRIKGAKLYDSIEFMQKSFSAIESCRLPVLAAIQGGAIGGAVDLITACDMRYMTSDGFLTVYEINIGMTADVGTFPRLAKLIPEGIAKELAYTGRRMLADEAKAVGLVNAIYEDQETLLNEVIKIAEQIANKAPLAIYGTKQIINYSRDHSTADALDRIGLWNASMLQLDEISEAINADKEKRAGDFVDLPARRVNMDTNIDN